MLGSVVDAEDIVQEAFLTLYKSDPDHIQNMKAYLCKIVTNRCLDLLRSTRKQREEYVGTWLPEPLVTTASEETDPIYAYLQKESLSTAYLLLLQQLSYIERAIFLLREVMQYDYEEIAKIVGKSSANCRLILHRAKRSLSVIDDSDHLGNLNREQNTNLVEQFISALTSSNTKQIMKLLSTDATFYTDGGGKVKTILLPLHGHIQIAQSTTNIWKKFTGNLTYRITMVNNLPGIVLYMDKKVLAVISLQIQKGQIANLYFVKNPDKLTHVC